MRKKKATEPQAPVITDEIKQLLGLEPFGKNVIVPKSELTSLQNMFLELHKIPVPTDVFRVLLRYCDKVRSLLGLCSIEELSDQWAAQRGESARYEAQQYICNCSRRQRTKRSKKDESISS